MVKTAGNTAAQDRSRAAAATLTPPPEAKRVRAPVFVACKLPRGINIMDYRKGVAREPILGGGTREYEVFQAVNGSRQYIKGPQTPFGASPQHEIVGGYAVTTNVDGEMFARWLEWNADNAMVRNNLIFMADTLDELRGKAKEFEKQLSGFEGLDVTMIRDPNGGEHLVMKDHRVDRPSSDNAATTPVQTNDTKQTG